MDKFFSIFGKVVLVLLVVGVIGGVAYYFGKQSSNKPKAASTTISPTVEPTQEAATPSAQPTTASSSKKTVSAGTTTKYSVTFPSDWTANQENQPGNNKLIISKDNYQIVISQGAGGAGACTYGNEPAQPMSQQFKTYVQINGSGHSYRRAASDQTPTMFSICEESNGSYRFPTSFGYITYNTPQNLDPSILLQMDSVVASITK